MIERLTKEQESRFAEFRDKWIAIGLSTEPADRQRAERAILLSYKMADIPPPRKIVWCGSPLSQGLTRAIVLDENMPASVGASVWDSVRASVGASVGDSVRDSVRASVWDSVRDSVRASVRDSVRDSVYGQHDAAWLSFYDYFNQACNLTVQTEKLSGLIELAKNAGWTLPHLHICWVSERHSIVARNERGQLHSLTGPAVMYPDGWKIYALNGIRVSAELVETPAEELDPLLFAKEQNAEIRREILRKVGIDRLCAKLGTKVIDKVGDYELHLVDLQGRTGLWPYLRMRNPSIDAWHMEAVAKECMTVQEALNWRNGGEFKHFAPLS